MRHRVKTRNLSRDIDHRRSLMKNLSVSLIMEEKIVTTVAKAKYLRPHIEKIISRARKGDDFNNVKFLRTKLHSEEAIKKLVSDLGKRFLERPGGYTRIIKLPSRKGDNAPMASIEFVEKPAKVKDTKETKKEAVKETKEKAKKVEKIKETTKKMEVKEKVVKTKESSIKRSYQNQKKV